MIKKFENFNMEEGYYSSISKDEYFENVWINNPMIEIDEKEILFIKNYLSTRGVEMRTGPDKQKVITGSNEVGSLFLSKSSDEWFYINFMIYSKTDPKEVHYKCDQLDGLLVCLDDIMKL